MYVKEVWRVCAVTEMDVTKGVLVRDEIMTDQTFAQVMMSGVVRFASVIAVLLAVALATMTEAVTRHTGVGIARRAAFHERLRAERAELDAAGGAVLPAETDNVVHVDALDVLNAVAEVGPNYTLLKPTETKKQRRKRQREQAAATQAQAVANDDANAPEATDEQQGAANEQESAVEARGISQHGGVQHSALADALEEEEDAVKPYKKASVHLRERTCRDQVADLTLQSTLLLHTLYHT